MLYFEEADKVSSTSSAACRLPTQLLQHVRYGADVMIPVKGVAGSSTLYHLYHVDVLNGYMSVLDILQRSNTMFTSYDYLLL